MDWKDWTCWRDASHPVGKHVLGWPQCKFCRAAPPYHERPRYIDPAWTATIYVPRDSRLTIRPASGVVGYRVGDEHVSIYFEGFVHSAFQYEGLPPIERWEGAIKIAADRMATDYPTVASMMVKEEALEAIGTYSPRSGEIVVTDEAALRRWVGIASEASR